jgi:hypothetical protein
MEKITRCYRKYDAAIRDYAEAIRLNPTTPKPTATGECIITFRAKMLRHGPISAKQNSSASLRDSVTLGVGWNRKREPFR